MRIFKYVIPVDGELHYIEMRARSTIVMVGSQEPETVTFWATVDESGDYRSERAFTVVATGERFSEYSYDYVGTAFDREYVWHLLERIF